MKSVFCKTKQIHTSSMLSKLGRELINPPGKPGARVGLAPKGAPRRGQSLRRAAKCREWNGPAALRPPARWRKSRSGPYRLRVATSRRRAVTLDATATSRLRHAQRRIDAGDLEFSRDSPARDAVGRQSGDVLASIADAARGRPEGATDIILLGDRTLLAQFQTYRCVAPLGDQIG